MRIILAAIALALTLPAAAQSTARPRPPGTVPLEEPPPPPAMIESDPALEPVVTTRTEGDQEIQEYRVKGKLYMMRVKPKNGPVGKVTFVPGAMPASLSKAFALAGS